MDGDGGAILLVQVCNQRYVVDTGQVSALRRKETLQPAPPGYPALVAVLPLGGLGVPVLDLGVCLAIGQAGTTRRNMLLITEVGEATVAFLVEQVEGPFVLNRKDIALLPPLIEEVQACPVVWAMVRYEDHLIPFLDLERVVPPEEAEAFVKLVAR